MTCFEANATPVSAEAAGCRAAAFLHRDAGQLQLLKSPYEYLVELQKAQTGMVAAGFHTRSRSFGFCNMMYRK